MLSREEVAAVMAHELAHVKHHDTLIMTITATIAGAISMLANFAFFFGGNRENNNPLGFVGVLLAMIVAPLAAMLVQMAISRTREYAADREGAAICGNPMWLASALEKIAGGAARIHNPDAERNPATAHMFIINPLSGEKMDNLFSTHPDTGNRIRALMELAGTGAASGGFSAHGQGRREESSMDSAPRRPRADPPGPWGRRKSAPSDRSRGPWG